jgi:hypothetical protein
VLEALRHAKLYINLNKTKLLCQEVDFLRHHISECGIKADTSKVDKILSWPIPKSATQTCSFIGLMRYLSAFLPDLAKHITALATLMTKATDKCFPPWSQEHQIAFDNIKKIIVVGRNCLTTINYDLMPDDIIEKEARVKLDDFEINTKINLLLLLCKFGLPGKYSHSFSISLLFTSFFL